MARTVYKTKMESFLTTPLALDELEFSSLADGCHEFTSFDNDDVFSDVLKGSPGAAEFSAQDLLDELDFQDGSDFMDMGWMTEKVDLNNTGTALSAEETITDLSAILDLPLPDTTLFDTQQENVTINETVVSGKEDPPRSPEQKVPDYLMSPVSVASPGSVSSVSSGILSPSPPSSPCHVEETGLPHNVQQTKQRRTPYSRGPQSPGVKPKVKTPEQKERKRTQNKDAATRYRIKKRDEQGVMLAELNGLEKTNTELKEQVSSLSKEIEYLKNLMLEVCKVKLQKQTQAV